MEAPFLPTLNACLNGTSALLLTIGYVFIRRKNVPAHRACMLSACFTSALFLTSYVVYHLEAGSVPFQGSGWVRLLYRSILLTHIVLAIVIVPMVLVTLIAALRGRIERHRKFARWTLPLWMYVSVTGVVIYGMLYHGHLE